MTINVTTNHIYRVAKFIVPASVRNEFLANADQAREVLKKQAGFVQDLYLEQPSETGEFNIVTIAEWESQEDVDHATAALAAYLQSIQFNPREVNQRLGVQTNAGFYKKIAV